MGFDYSKLEGRIIEVCKTRSEFAKRMTISERTISLKLNKKIFWKQNEIIRACDILKISYGDIPTYFFNLNVQIA